MDEPMSDRSQRRAAANLAQAVKTMRDACDSAQRAAAGGDSDACQRVLHALAWGFANATSSIETAMSCVDDAHVLRAVESAAAQEKGAEHG